MRILAIDYNACGLLSWCMRAQDDGHQVKLFHFQNEKNKHIGRGIVEIVDDWKKWMRWADFVFLGDNTKYIKEMDSWRKDGIKIIGANQEIAEWELDREIGQKVLKKHGIPTIPYKIFNDYDQAIKYVKKENKRFVSKPSGDEPDKALSYVSKSPADMVYMLERWKGLGKLKTPFILQEFIGGTEMAVGAWCGPGGFNQGFCENFEFKKFMPGDLGISTGEQGTTLRYVKKSKLADKVLRPLEESLVKTGYTGYIDVNCIIDDKGNPWPLEFTSRCGFPTINIQMSLNKGDSAQWLMDLAEGRDARNWILDKVAIGVVLSIPDFPYSRYTGKEVVGIPIYNLTDKIMKDVHLLNCMMGEAPCQVGDQILTIPMFVTAGDYVLVTTGIGDTIAEAKKGAYRVLKKIEIPNSPMYRIDIGDRLKKQLPDIQKCGYAEGLTW